ncbi:MAG: type I-E CRISPR-associated protein Cas6/Cse3/CasE [Nitrospira bacterium HGW-Nitrospira-1]|nr:MAG: type I-E CRISPR-associated protein Cas6/Cse3/CasE [Nitrospira bacterium HGW-Nitrospira-1]
MFFSMIRLRRDVSPKEIAGLVRGDGYSLHRLIWNLFSDGPDRKRDFLYRYESVNGWPTFYAVSAREPADSGGLWEVTPKIYEPRLSKGERLAFKLRVNPIQHDKKERTEPEIEAWCASRIERGLKEKLPTKKRIRHDVVMEAKTKLNFKEMPHDKRPHVATLIQEAGVAWLKTRETEQGFLVEDDKDKPAVRADGYCQHRLFKGKEAKPITFSTLDFNGILTVTDPDTFIEESLYSGIGRAKAFGCGLMLVRRI